MFVDFWRTDDHHSRFEIPFDFGGPWIAWQNHDSNRKLFQQNRFVIIGLSFCVCACVSSVNIFHNSEHNGIQCQMEKRDLFSPYLHRSYWSSKKAHNQSPFISQSDFNILSMIHPFSGFQSIFGQLMAEI